MRTKKAKTQSKSQSRARAKGGRPTLNVTGILSHYSPPHVTTPPSDIDRRPSPSPVAISRTSMRPPLISLDGISSSEVTTQRQPLSSLNMNNIITQRSSSAAPKKQRSSAAAAPEKQSSYTEAIPVTTPPVRKEHTKRKVSRDIKSLSPRIRAQQEIWDMLKQERYKRNAIKCEKGDMVDGREARYSHCVGTDYGVKTSKSNTQQLFNNEFVKSIKYIRREREKALHAFPILKNIILPEFKVHNFLEYRVPHIVGKNIADLSKWKTFPDVETIHRFKDELVTMIKFIHYCGFLHNDLADRNIIISHKNNVWQIYIIDFDELTRISNNKVRRTGERPSFCSALESVDEPQNRNDNIMYNECAGELFEKFENAAFAAAAAAL